MFLQEKGLCKEDKPKNLMFLCTFISEHVLACVIVTVFRFSVFVCYVKSPAGSTHREVDGTMKNYN